VFDHFVIVHWGENIPKSKLTCFKNRCSCFSKLPFEGIDIEINSVYTCGVVILCHWQMERLRNTGYSGRKKVIFNSL